MEQEFRRLYDQLISSGMDQARARNIGLIHHSLICSASKLIQCENNPTDEDEKIGIGAGCPGLDLPVYDDVLIPGWKKFARALKSFSGRKDIVLILDNVELTSRVTKLLLQSLKVAPVTGLVLGKLGLENEGVEFATNVLEVNDNMETLFISESLIESRRDVCPLIRSIMNHPNILVLKLDGCGIGGNDDVMREIVSLFESRVKVVRIDNDGIGSREDRDETNGFARGIAIIGKGLIGNPSLKVLALENNSLNDFDATLLALALGENTKLRELRLKGNPLRRAGMFELCRALYNCDGTMNALYDSNHICKIDVDRDRLSFLNTSNNPSVNRKAKLLCALNNCFQAGSIETKIGVDLSNLHIKLMPFVLAFIQ
ncbi:hypothetical protein ACHAWF_014954, partial [Thalassiosira exigua]